MRYGVNRCAAGAARPWVGQIKGFTMVLTLARAATGATLLVAVLASLAEAQPDPRGAQPTAAQVGKVSRGFDLFGGAGVSWPSARDSFQAVALPDKPIDFGGGARVRGIWQRMFAQVSVARWSDAGERAFVDSGGQVFPLGIPLEVASTFIDGTIGIQFPGRTRSGRTSYVFYVGGGAGVVRYSERSPFAAASDDLQATKPSYHGMAGIEIPLVGGLAVAGEGRYRHIPGLLGDDGVSAALGDESLGGFQTSVGLRMAFGGSRAGSQPRVPAPPASAPRTGSTPTPRVEPPVATPTSPAQQVKPSTRERLNAHVLATAPVFLLPDAARVPLRTLDKGTVVRVIQEQGDWLQIEFNDPQYGTRSGYIQRRYVQAREK